MELLDGRFVLYSILYLNMSQVNFYIICVNILVSSADKLLYYQSYSSKLDLSIWRLKSWSKYFFCRFLKS